MGAKLLTYEAAITQARAAGGQLSVLLGNGFSIDYSTRHFAYESLADEAKLRDLSVGKRRLFRALGSDNFEIVMDKLRAASALQMLYGGNDELADRFENDARVVRNGLADVLATRHPDSFYSLTRSEVEHARAFLSPFKRIYTLNYDLLLYWAVLSFRGSEHAVVMRDGFERPTLGGPNILVWKRDLPAGKSQQIFYLHGALHLFVRKMGKRRQLTKLSRAADGNLVDALRARLKDNDYPLVVTEGTSAEKLERIERSAYLRNALRSFTALEGSLFVHGVSMHNDGHILDAIEADRSAIRRLYVGLHNNDASVRARAEEIAAKRRAGSGSSLKVRFYDAASSHVWRG